MDRFDVYLDGDHTGMLDVEGRDFSFRYNRVAATLRRGGAR